MKYKIRGFTLVECIVALALSGIIMTTMWMVFSTNARQGAKTSEKLDGIKGAISFIQRFEYDLARLYLDNDHPLTIFNNGDKKIEFYVYLEKHSNLSTQNIGTEKISYYFSSKRHGIYRQVNEKKKKRLRGYYEHWLLERQESPLPLINYLITSVSPLFFKKPETQRKAHERVTFQGSIPLQHILELNLYPNWNPAPIYSSEE